MIRRAVTSARRLPSVWRHVKRLHRDERGAEGLEKLLIIAAIVLPLLGLLIFFASDITEWVRGLWDRARGEAESLEDETFGGSSTP